MTSRKVGSTRIAVRIRAPRARVYALLLDAQAIPQWRVPEGMRCQVHAFDAREGGAFRVSLTYDAPTGAGKTSAHTDTYRGRFLELVPDEKVVEAVEFESRDAAMQGEMTITTTLVEVEGDTELAAVHDGLPPGVSPADNETGWRMALDKLRRLAESEA